MTPRSRSDRSKKGWRSRHKMAAARAEDQPAHRETVGYDRILAATTPEKSSAAVAAELGVHPAYVRNVWRYYGLPPRPAGKRPPVCASSPRPTHDPTT